MNAPTTLGIECVCGDINLPGVRECEGCGRPLGMACVGCGGPLPTGVAGRPRKWCGESCRDTARVKVPAAPVVPRLTPEEKMRQWWVDNLGEAESKRIGEGLAA